MPKTIVVARENPCSISKQMKVNQYRFLASSVLNQAIKDAEIKAWQDGILYFIESDWCRELCEFARVQHKGYCETVIEAIEKEKKRWIKTNL